MAQKVKEDSDPFLLDIYYCKHIRALARAVPFIKSLIISNEVQSSWPFLRDRYRCLSHSDTEA